MAPTPPVQHVLLPASHSAGSKVYLVNPSSTSETLKLGIMNPLPPQLLVVRIIYPYAHEYSAGKEESGRKAVDLWDRCLPDLPSLLTGMISSLLSSLYPDDSHASIIQRKQVLTIRLLEYGGLAATHDDMIDISLDWLRTHAERAKTPEDLAASGFEFRGVLLHELVHIYQHDGQHTAPWWFIEGLADFVRYDNSLGASHWGPPGSGDNWTQGYQMTGMFLSWLDRQTRWGGPGVVRRMNDRLQFERWPGGADDRGEGGWWRELSGYRIEELWNMYKAEHAGDGTAKGGDAIGEAFNSGAEPNPA